MMDHPARARVAEVTVSRIGKENTRGSGYLVLPGWVLTAHHVVRDAASVGVWLGARPELVPEAGVGVDVGQVLTIPAMDLALLPVGRRESDPLCEPALFGRLDRDPGPPVPVAAAGCPRFKLRPAPARPDVLLRELEYAIGRIAPMSDAKTDRFAFAVDVAPGPDPEPDKHSPWEGMSGAAVWASGRLIGVVAQHHPREGLATLTVCPIEQLFGSASAAELEAWRAALPQLPTLAEELWLATPPTPPKIEVARARRAAEALAPGVLIGRSADLAALEAFTGSGARWRWIQGDAFAGKTALMAWLALHPPECVDVAACFLRRASGENTADYALDVLNRQLAVLADRRGYLPPAFVSERVNDLVDLLEEAARACTERSRALLMLVDGLDEYDAATTGLDLAAWLPDASTLPGEATLLVASRSGADVRLPPGHPLHGHVHTIAASDAATQIGRMARAELDRALTTPGGFVYPLVCCLAVADSGLTASELRGLLELRGRDVDVGEIQAVLGGSLSRSLTPSADLDSLAGDGYAFAHNSLLAAARARLASDLSAYEDLLDVWASEYARLDWPVEAPRYLLSPYARQLARRAHDTATPNARRRAAADQLFAVVADRWWLRLLFEQTGNPALPDQEIVAAQQVTVRTGDSGGLDPEEVTFRLAVLALRRQPITAGKASISAAVAAVWARIGRGSAALGLAAGISHPMSRCRALSEVALALAQTGQGGLAVQAATSVDDPKERAQALSAVAEALAKAGQATAAADVGEQALQAATGIQNPLTLGLVAEHLAKAGQAGPALQAVTSIDETPRRAWALSLVAKALAAAGQAEPAADAARQALQATEGIDTQAGQAWALSWVAEALAKTGQAEPAANAARQALQTATDIDYPMWRAQALGRLAETLAKTRQAIPAVRAAESALQVAVSVSNPGERAWILNAAAQALVKTSQAGLAMQAAADIDNPEMRADALRGVADVLAKTGQPGRILQAAAGVDNPQRRAHAFAMVAEVLAATGQAGLAANAAGQARQAATSVDDPGRRAWALCAAAQALNATGQAGAAADTAEQALQAATSIDDPGRRAWALCAAAQALNATGQAGAAAEALQAATGVDNHEEQARALSAAAKTLAQAGQAGLALKAAVGIGDPEERAQALAAVAKALALAGQPTAAANAAGQALRAASNIDDPRQPDWVSTSAAVAKALAKAGQADSALRAATDIDDPPRRDRALSNVAQSLAKAGQVESALQAATGINDPSLRTQALSSVAQSPAEARHAEPTRQAVKGADDQEGQVRAKSLTAEALAETGPTVTAAAHAAGRALQAAACVDDPAGQARALSAASEALAGTGHATAAANAAEQALRAATGVVDPEGRALAFSMAAGALTKAGRPTVAADAAGQALQAAADIDSPSWLRAFALSRLAGALAKAAQAAAAADAAKQVLLAAAATDVPEERTKALDAWTWANVLLKAERITPTAQSDQAGIALQTALSIEDLVWRGTALGVVAKGLAEMGQPGLAAHAAGHALQVASSIDDPQRQAWVLTTTAGALVAAGQPMAAADAAGKALQIAAAASFIERVQTASRVAGVLADMGQAGMTADAVMKVVQAVTRVHDPAMQAEVLSGAASALAQTGQITAAADAAMQALEAATHIDDPAGRAQALRCVAEALAQAAQPTAAADAAGQALQAVASINDPVRQASELATLLRGGRGDRETRKQALDLLLSTPNAADHLEVLPTAILQRLVMDGHLASSDRPRISN